VETMNATPTRKALSDPFRSAAICLHVCALMSVEDSVQHPALNELKAQLLETMKAAAWALSRIMDRPVQHQNEEIIEFLRSFFPLLSAEGPTPHYRVWCSPQQWHALPAECLVQRQLIAHISHLIARFEGLTDQLVSVAKVALKLLASNKEKGLSSQSADSRGSQSFDADDDFGGLQRRRVASCWKIDSADSRFISVEAARKEIHCSFSLSLSLSL
jgi:hypothetical protein